MVKRRIPKHLRPFQCKREIRHYIHCRVILMVVRSVWRHDNVMVIYGCISCIHPICNIMIIFPDYTAWNHIYNNMINFLLYRMLFVTLWPKPHDAIYNRKMARNTYCTFEAKLCSKNRRYHYDVIKWKYFPRYWPYVWGIHRWPVNSSHKGQWRGALTFPLICAWINDWVNSGEAGDLRRQRARYDAIVMDTPFWRSISHFFPNKISKGRLHPVRKCELQLHFFRSCS